MQYCGYPFSKKTMYCLSEIQMYLGVLCFYLLNLAPYISLGKKQLDGMNSMV